MLAPSMCVGVGRKDGVQLERCAARVLSRAQSMEGDPVGSFSDEIFRLHAGLCDATTVGDGVVEETER